MEQVKQNHEAPTPGGARPAVKRLKFGWSDLGQQGDFSWVPKTDLHIDRSYQRDPRSTNKVAAIARDFDWFRFGVLGVVRRPDGKLVVVEGQHRVLAAAMRDDVSTVPCMIFEWDSLPDEARAFIDVNTARSNATPYERHKAGLVAGDPVALKSQEIVEDSGYDFTGHSGDRHTIKAVSTVHSMVEDDPEFARRIIRLAADIASGDAIKKNTLDALHYVGKRSPKMFNGVHRERLVELGQDVIDAEIRRKREIVGKGGMKVSAAALVDVLNKGRRTRKIEVDLT